MRNTILLTLFLGYGVELQIKSSEYKAQDDRQVQADSESGEDLTDENVEKARDIEGFIFNTLNNQNPDDKEKLTEFKQFLLDQVTSLNYWSH